VELPWLDDLVRAKRPQHLPVVLTRDEVRAVLQGLDGVPRLMAILLYGAGLRLLECCRLRVKDVDFAMNQITIRSSACASNTKPTSGTAPAGSSYPARSCASTRMPAGSGAGSGSSWPRAPTWTASQASGAATTSTNPCFSER